MADFTELLIFFLGNLSIVTGHIFRQFSLRIVFFLRHAPQNSQGKTQQAMCRLRRWRLGVMETRYVKASPDSRDLLDRVRESEAAQTFILSLTEDHTLKAPSRM